MRSAVRCSGRPTAAAYAASYLTTFSRARSFSNAAPAARAGRPSNVPSAPWETRIRSGCRTRFPLRGLFLTLMTSLIWAAIAACILYLLLHLGLRT